MENDYSNAKFVYYYSGNHCTIIPTCDNTDQIAINARKMREICLTNTDPNFIKPILFRNGSHIMAHIKPFPCDNKKQFDAEIREYEKRYPYSINEWKSYYTCDCGSYIRKDSKHRHIKSYKHQIHINQ